MVGVIRLLKHRVKHALAPYPFLFVTAYRLFAPAHLRMENLIGARTEIVIEGYPRSANTFAVVAFRLAQNRPVKIAHHLHMEAQIWAGVKRSLPVLVLVREPVSAVTSLKIRYPELDIPFAFRYYVRFYSAVKRVFPKVIVADFTEVTTDFGAVIARINRKFSADFRKFEHTPDNMDRVLAEIENIRRRTGSTELQISRPSRERELIKDAIRTQVLEIVPDPLYNRA